MGGPTYVALGLVKELRSQGVDVEILTTNHDGCDVMNVPLGCESTYRDMPVWFFPCSRIRLKDFIYSPGMMEWLVQNVSKYDLVDIHYLFCYTTLIAARIAKKMGVPYTIRTQGQMAPWSLKQKRLKKWLYLHVFEKSHLSPSGAIHCTTKGEASDVRKSGWTTAPIIILPIGIDTNLVENIWERRRLLSCFKFPPKCSIILFMSRLHYTKKPETTILMFQQIFQIFPLARLIMAGSGNPPYVSALKSMVSRLQLHDKVFFTGLVDGIIKSSLLHHSDVFVLPSSYENFGIVVMEAMSRALPVVISKEVQLAPDVARVNAGIVTQPTTDDFVDAVKRLLQNPDLAKKMGASGKKLVAQNYRLSQVVKQLIVEYRKVIDACS
jgi:glycosyltransferase involved in cell wall biosynthesis